MTSITLVSICLLIAAFSTHSTHAQSASSTVDGYCRRLFGATNSRCAAQLNARCRNRSDSLCNAWRQVKQRWACRLPPIHHSNSAALQRVSSRRTHCVKMIRAEAAGVAAEGAAAAAAVAVVAVAGEGEEEKEEGVVEAVDAEDVDCGASSHVCLSCAGGFGGRAKSCDQRSGADKQRCEQFMACKQLTDEEERALCKRQTRCSRFTGQNQIDCMKTPRCSDYEDPAEEAQCRVDLQCSSKEGAEKRRCEQVAKLRCRQIDDEDERNACRIQKLCGYLTGTEKEDCESEASTRCDQLDDEEEREECYETRRARQADRRQLREINLKLRWKAEREKEKSERVSAVLESKPRPEVAEKDPKSKSTLTEQDVNAGLGLYGGDMDLTHSQAQQIVNDAVRRQKRKVGKAPKFDIWNKMPIAYQFDARFSNTYRDIVRQAIKLWQDNTCVRWQENGPDADRIEFYSGGGCSSYVGRTGGVQEISIAVPGCHYIGIIAHEIGHSLGFMHEQARPDQAQHVNIKYNNISPSRWNNFLPSNAREVNDYGLPYDYGSVMHYDGYGFALNPAKATIQTIDPYAQHTIGQRNGPSFVDFAQVNAAYCSSTCRSKLSCQHGGYTDPNDCNQCKCPDGFGGTLCDTVGYSTCGGDLTAYSNANYIQSPGYPNRFGSTDECVWRISTQPGSKITLTFEGTFEMACKDSCDDSHVEVKRGDDWRRTGYRFCCDTRPADSFVSEDNEMVVIFRNLGGARRRGFKAKYTANTGTSGSNQGATPPTTTTPAYSTTTPVPPGGVTTVTNPPNCRCGQWGAWQGGCSSSCGGCGERSRTRSCSGGSDCLSVENKKCNLNVCSGSQPFKFENGKLQILINGCCVGLFRNGATCDSLTGAFSSFGFGKVGGGGGGGSSGGGGGLPKLPSFLGGSSGGGGGSPLGNLGGGGFIKGLLGGGPGGSGGGNPLGGLTSLFGQASPRSGGGGGGLRALTSLFNRGGRK